MKSIEEVRAIIRELILEELLAEPDELESDEGLESQDEQSTTASITGVTVPLGRGPTYPAASPLEEPSKKKSVKQTKK